MTDQLSRRNFVKTGAAAAAGVAASLASPRAAGANERIRLGFIGVANRGGQLIKAALPHDDCEIAAVCDVYKPIMAQRAEELGGIDQHADFRDLIARKDLDAVVIATPDHWHAIQTIMACESGKDVYVEKPLSVTIHEGRRMVEAARRTKRVVQVGTHRRSSTLYDELHGVVQSGAIGKVTVAHCYRLSNMWPDGMGKCAPTAPPEDLDWDMWLGPRAERPYQENITPYKFRWWQSYSSQIGNWGVHYFDLIRWMLDEQAPVSISAHGGRYAVDDDRTIPDTMTALFELGSGCLVIFGQYEASQHPMMPGEIDLRGTKGIAYARGSSYEIIPERGGQFQSPKPRMEPMEGSAKGSNHDLTTAHMRNFLDCVKSRATPNADVEEGHRSTTFSHLGNIALATRSRIEWDPKTERIVSPEDANALLHYEYRKPWTLG